ncbi:type I secretion system permease/ATPase [Alphaproteobacteria bacterium]|nr:type I secretion system permease/ATPase [Alphaproteobacteria bacterium]
MKKNWFLLYISNQKKFYLQAILASIFINIFALITSVYIMVIYDRIIPNNAISSLISIIIGVLFVISMDFSMKMLRGYFLDMAGKQIDSSSSRDIFQKIVGYDLSKAPKFSGELVSVVREFETFREFFNSITLTSLVDFPFILVFLAVIYGIGGNIAFVPGSIVPVVIIFGLLLQPVLKQISEDSQKDGQAKQTVLGEMINGLETVKTVSGGTVLKTRWMDAVNAQSKTSIKSRIFTQLALNFAGIGQQLSQVGIIGFGVLAVSSGDMSMGALIACTILSGRTLAPLGQIGGLMGRLNSAKAAYHSVTKFMLEASREETAKEYFPRNNILGSIEFSHVNFSYAEDTQIILNDLNLKINAGEKVAVIGKIGSGKTTLLKLILGLYQPNNGSTLIDGANIQQIRPEDIRRQFGVVMQNTYLFSGSIRENIAFGLDEISTDEIDEAATIAGVTDFTKKMNNGLDYQLSEGGKDLSGGQRQAIALARAIVRKPAIILLDEPTSAMDLTSERQIIRNLKSYFTKQTLVVVTHRMSLLQLVDRVIAVDDGKVTVDGSRESILNKLKDKPS